MHKKQVKDFRDWVNNWQSKAANGSHSDFELPPHQNIVVSDVADALNPD